ncbi:SCO6880 family protein [Amycolatopsis sp. NBC_01480]|uniref:SCO6880 family protein n=1 Tax=Amycolatopsis sp. NBC_01480 TaxID=2903562 RepID=UPI002E2A78BB|nr:SCO6880 family protein [Amycolatopsis sp. NBC_01480]
MSTGPRVYTGLARREHAGWLLGVQPGQAAACVLLALPVVAILSAGDFTGALAAAAGCGPAIALVVVPVRGRPAARWLAHLLLFQVGIALGWSRWQSKASAGHAVDPAQPDLPGTLTRLRFPEGPPMRDLGRICLIHDTAEGRWGATAKLVHSGVGMLSEAQCQQLANRLGNLLATLAHSEVIDRMSLVVRTVPDTGVEYAAWCASHEAPDVPAAVRRAARELDRTVGAVSVRHEVFVTFTGPEDALRRPAAAAGGGVDGRAVVLYRVLDGLEDKLRALGAQRITWLSGGGLAEAIRTGFNPATAASLAARRAGVPWAAAGPGRAPSPTARVYQHDGFATVSYAVLMPEAGTLFGSLGGLLAVRTAGERRSLAIHYETLSPRRARRVVRAGRFRVGVVRDVKRSKGFNGTAADTRSASGARAQENAVAAGHGLVRFAVAAAVSVPAEWAVEDHAARMENDIAGRFQLLRMDLAQDSGFVTAVLPVGIGLPKLRGAGL